MRLTSCQIVTLKQVAQEVFGPQAQLQLFGSRLDDQRAGGDIDLYITGFNGTLEEQMEAKATFLARAKCRLGEQRIDVVFAPLPGQNPSPIQKVAAQTAQPL